MLLIFDLDYVLVDLASSTRQAAARAAQSYLQEICLIPHSDQLISTDLIHTLKASGGFSNNHDLTTAILYYLLASVPSFMRPRAHKAKRIRDVQRAFKKKPIPHRALLGHSERAPHIIANKTQESGGGLQGLYKAYSDGVVRELILSDGSIGATEREQHDSAAEAPIWQDNAPLPHVETRENAVSRLFEEHYLGDDLFTQTYGVPPLQPRGNGLHKLETLRCRIETLRDIAALGPCALVVDETEERTKDILNRLELTDIFDLFIKKDDIPKMPPQPFAEPHQIRSDRATWRVSRIIEACVQHHRRSFDPSDVFYISKDHDTMIACTRLHMNGVGFTLQREERKPLKEAGAKTVVSKHATLARALYKRAERNAQNTTR